MDEFDLFGPSDDFDNTDELGDADLNFFADAQPASLSETPDFRTSGQKEFDSFLYAIPNSVIGGISEVAESMPFVDEKDADALTQLITTEEQYRDFKDKEEGYKLVGAIATSIPVIFGMQKLMRSKSLLTKAESILGKKTSGFLLPTSKTDLDRVEEFRQQAATYARKQGNTISKETTPALDNMFRKNIGVEAIDAMKIGIATDAAIYGAVGTNDFLFPEDMSATEIALMYGLPNVLISAASGAMIRYKMKNVIRDLGPEAAEARNKGKFPIAESTSRVGERGLTATVLFGYSQNKKVESAEAIGDSVLETNINTIEQAYNKAAFDQVDLMASDSVLPGVTNRIELNSAQKETIQTATDLNHGILTDVVSIEKYNPEDLNSLSIGVSKTVAEKQKQSAELLKMMIKNPENTKLKEKLGKEFNQLKNQIADLEEHGVFKIGVDGNVNLLKDVKPVFADSLTGKTKQTVSGNLNTGVAKSNFGDIVKVVEPNREAGSGATLIGHAAKFGKTNDKEFALVKTNLEGFLNIEGKQTPINAENYGRLNRAGKTALQSLVKKTVDEFDINTSPLLEVTDKTHHTTLDGILELADKFGKNSPQLLAKISLNGNGLQSVDHLEFLSLQGKFKEFQKGIVQIGDDSLQHFKTGKGDQKNLDDLLTELNLPNNNVTGFHPLNELFIDLQKRGIAGIESTMPDLASVVTTLEKSVLPRGNLDGSVIKKGDIEFRGKNLTTYETPREPVILVAKSTKINPFQIEDLINASSGRRFKTFEKLRNAHTQGATLVSAITGEATKDLLRFQEARGVQYLYGGSALRSDRFTQTMDGLQNQPVIKAIDSIANETENVTNAYIKSKFDEFDTVFTKINSTNAKADMNSYAIGVHQLGVGWRGTPDLVQVTQKDGSIGYKIKLEKHSANDDMIEKVYGATGKDVEKFDFVPAPNFSKDVKHEDLVLTQLAADTLLGMNALSQDVRLQINGTRQAVNQAPLAMKPLHSQPKNLSGKELIYLLNSETGKVFSVASGNTALQAKKVALEEIRVAKDQGVKIFQATEKDLENYNILKLEDFDRMVDFSSGFKQTGQAKGTSFGSIIETGPEVLKRQQDSIINQYKTVSKVTTGIMFEGEFRAAKLAAETSGLGKTTLDKGQTIWDSYIRRALGNKSGSDKQTIGKFYGAVEDVYDKIIQSVWDNKIQALKGGISKSQGEKEFKGLQDALPDYNPFKDSEEFLSNTMRIKAPHNMLRHSAFMNNVTGALMLRMMNLGLASINLLSLPTIIPVVSNALKLKPGEDVNKWKKLNAAWSSDIDESTAAWNPYRVATTGMHYFFTKEGRAVMKEAGDRGHLQQKAVEQMQLFTSPAQGYSERMVKKSVDFTSLAVDKTEEWSRGLSYVTFFKFGKDRLNLENEASMEFAHHMANRVIGDFRPNNRPQIFQGAVGMPFGLFTTFAWNYFQRIFNYVEKGDFSSFFQQMGLQASFFGSKSLPGFNQYVDNFTANYDGDENMVDRLHEKLGGTVTDALLFGSIGSATDTAIYTRADLRLPGSNFLYNYNISDMAPAAGLIGNTYKGISETVKSMRANEGINETQILETMSRTFPISGVKGMIDASMGRSVDSRGQIITSELNSAKSIGAKIFGMKTIKEQSVIEDFAREHKTRMIRQDARKEFRLGLRSLFRGGKLNSENFEGLIAQYGKSTGGDYENLAKAVVGEVEFALVDKSYLKLLEKVSSESKERRMLRLASILSRE